MNPFLCSLFVPALFPACSRCLPSHTGPPLLGLFILSPVFPAFGESESLAKYGCNYNISLTFTA